MPTLEQTPQGEHTLTPEEYIRQNFEPSDRLAVVVINREERNVVQRVDTAQTIAAPKYQAWLRHENAHGSDVYISQNTLRETAKGRTKEDIAVIRHVYLDLINGGGQAVAAVENSRQVPPPSYLITSSPGKYQVIWKVEGMTLDQAEALQRAMVREFGADPAATDSARVLRLPGFYNKKYEQPFRVVAEKKSEQTYWLGDFQISEAEAQTSHQEPLVTSGHAQARQIRKSPSEHDWRWAIERIKRGQSIKSLIERLVDYRDDKPNPEYYARRTITSAYARVALSRGDDPEEVVRTISHYPPRPYENGEQYARVVVQQNLEKLGRANDRQQNQNVAGQHTQQLGLRVTP
jgi:RepB DNA-primase from phage plasmid